MNRIKQLRLDAGILQSDLATRLKVRQGTVSNWETGKYEPDQDALKLLANFFDVSVDYLVGNTDIKKPPTPEGMSGLTPKQLKILEMMDQMTPAQQDEMVRQAEYQLWQQQNGKGGQ